MMNRKDFFEYVKDNVKDYLPEKYADANIHLQEVVKKNGLTLTAVVIPAKDTNITPNVYLGFLLPGIPEREKPGCLCRGCGRPLD